MINAFIEMLAAQPGGDALFNPWSDRDPLHDAAVDAPRIRREQLERYLSQRQASARWLLIAEGLSYQGGKFTGMAMTSERILLGGKDGIPPDAVFRGEKRQTSNKPGGFNEPTASIVWSALLGAGIDPYSWVNWNAFPWHPRVAGNPLSNRAPTPQELRAAQPMMQAFQGLFPQARTVAVGAKCAGLLAQMQVPHVQVRHPARGGANEFRAQVLGIVGA